MSTNIIGENTEVYNIICDSIGIEPKANNGTLRLPLRPVGLHSDNPSSAEDSPTDFSPDGMPPAMPASPEISEPNNTSDEEVEATGTPKETKEEIQKLWAYAKAKMAAAQEWAKKVIASLKDNHKDPDEGSRSFDQGDTPT